MSAHSRVGIRAARMLLSLLEESSSEELEAAESILGGEKELIDILQLLRKYKEHEEEPLTKDQARDILRDNILALPLNPDKLAAVIFRFKSTEGIRLPPRRTTANGPLEGFISQLEATTDNPSDSIGKIIKLLTFAVSLTNAEYETKVASVLRDLVLRALTENLIFFPTSHALAQLRLKWAKEPLTYKHQETRRSIVRRLLKDLEQASNSDELNILGTLLREGLRGPADGEIATLSRMNRKKAQGE
jgi:hypothetical protein